MNHGLTAKYISDEDIAWAIENGYWEALWRALNAPTRGSGMVQLAGVRQSEPLLDILVRDGSMEVIRAFVGADRSDLASSHLNLILDYAMNRTDVEIVSFLLSGEPLLPFFDDPLRSLLRIPADRVPSREMITVLASAARACGAPERSATRVLSEYARRGWSEHIRRLCAMGIGVDLLDTDGWTALMRAASQGHIGTVQILLELGADPNLTTVQGNCALSEAVNRDLPELEELLRRAGAIRPDEVDRDLHRAILWRDMEAVIRLVSRGADLEQAGATGLTPLMAAIVHFPMAVPCLVEAGANAQASVQTTTLFLSPWYLAAAHGRFDVVDLLMRHGADVNAAEPLTQSTALHAASKAGETQVVRLLIDSGADIEARDNRENTPLVLASHGGHIDAVRVLIESGADLTPRNSEGRGVCDFVPGFTFYRHPDFRTGELRSRHEKIASMIARAEANASPDDLVHAVKRGDFDAVARLLREGVDPNVADHSVGEGQKPIPVIHQAVADNRLDIVEALHAAGAVIDWQTTYYGYTNMEMAIHSGSTELVAFAMRTGANLNAEGRRYKCLLTSAVNSGNPKMIEFLANAGARVSGLDDHADGLIEEAIGEATWKSDLFAVMEFVKAGVTVGDILRSAACRDGCEIVRWCLERGTDVSDRDTEGRTALYHAVMRSPFPWNQEFRAIDAIRLMLQNGADPNDMQPGDFSLFTCSLRADTEDSSAVARMLLDAGADPNLGVTSALIFAATWGQVYEVEYLLRRGVDVNFVDRLGDTAWIAAKRNGRKRTVEILEAAGAREPDGIAGDLHRAIRWNKAEDALRFIRSGADVEQPDADGQTPLVVAVDVSENVEIVAELLRRGANPNACTSDASGVFPPQSALECAATRRNIEIMTLLLDAGADPDGPPCSEQSPLQAIFPGDFRWDVSFPDDGDDLPMVDPAVVYQCAQLLLSRRADPDGVNLDWDSLDNRTPLHHAIMLGYLPLVELLLDHGANVNPKRDFENSELPLHTALSTRAFEIARYLIYRGADVNAVDADGDTPIFKLRWRSSSMPREEVIAMMRDLIAAGADINAQGSDGKTLLKHIDDRDLRDELIRLGALEAE